jgi:sialate O-acetylesterase
MYKYIITVLFLTNLAYGYTDWQRVVDLRGQWKFSLGDNQAWAEPDFDDSDWETIFAPADWEDEGFPGYDGYAWYRKRIYMGPENKGKSLYIRLWYIDDVDEVYINGHFVGFQGFFPPNYTTAYNIERNYPVPQDYLNFDGENVICVRVYDKELHGGIVNGRIGVYERLSEPSMLISLDGIWKFNLGDDPEWKLARFNDRNWEEVMVPLPWETQGYKDYNGMAWYRKKVFIPEKYRGERLVLFLGRIDDFDETYFNDVLVGQTGSIDEDSYYFSMTDDYLQWRAYRLDEDDIRFGADNVIAVRVYDGMIHGGIYEGPLGITTYEKYREWSYKSGERQKSFFEKLFERAVTPNFD